MRNYLMNRCQYVQVQNEVSDIKEITCGVPQGTNIGPLLFNMMLYDLKFVEVKSMIIKYADDTVMLTICNEEESILDIIKQDLEKLVNYYRTNGLEINFNKSYYMKFNGCKDKEIDELMSLNEIRKVESLKYLGVNIDSRLNMREYANNLKSKLSQSIYALNVIKSHLPAQQKLQFYHGYVGSHLNYCSFLMSRLNIGQIEELQRLQNRSLKLIHGLNYRTPTLDVFKIYFPKILPVTGIFYLSHIMLIKKSIINQDGSMLDLEMIQDGRRAGNLKVKRFKSRLLEKDVSSFGALLYNQLPDEIKAVQGLKSFKKQSKSFLLTKLDLLLSHDQLKTHKFY
jgi:hypothetical protein